MPKSIIDITLTNLKGNRILKGWKVDPSPSMSDHKYVTFGLQIKNTFSYTFRRCFNKIDWSDFKSEMQKIDPPEVGYGIEGIDASTNWLHDQIWSYLKINCPKALVRDRKNKWWNGECDSLRRKVRKLLRIKDKSEATTLELKRLNKLYKKAIFSAKESSWGNFTSELDNIKDIGRVAKALRNPPRRDIGALCQGGPKETVTKLLETHFPGCRPTTNSPGGLGFQRSKLTTMTPSVCKVQKVKEAIKSFGDNKAVGADGLPPKALKELPDKYYVFITELYNRCLEVGYTPIAWREMKVVYIPKPGKSGLLDSQSVQTYYPLFIPT